MQQVPKTYPERQRIRDRIENLPMINQGAPANRSLREQLEIAAKSVLENEDHLAWTMVLIGSKLWRRQVQAVPITQRLLLLPHCLRNAEQCPAEYDAEGLRCQNCGACELGNLKSFAESLGYRVLIAEGSPIVMQWILSGKVSAILGVGCLRSLEKAFEKIQLAGIPALAVPLHASNCKDSTTDIDWVLEMIRTPFEPAGPQDVPPTYVHLLRGAAKLFPQERGSGPPPASPVSFTESIAADFLTRGGKFYRPFITLAVYDALTGSACTGDKGEQHVEQLPHWVKSAAKTIEIFHKASLVHDDIEDDDQYRYGKPTLHQTFGIASAINVGDYLLGFGYNLIAELRKEIDGNIVAEMLAVLSSAHCRLSIGQGTELAWKAKGIIPSAEDILRFYVGKTSPAFEAALNIGVLLAVASKSNVPSPSEGGLRWGQHCEIDEQFYHDIQEKFTRFSKHLGAAFQIKNDLNDWIPDASNKKLAGTDMLAQRPTLLHAWAQKLSKDHEVNLSQHSVADWYAQFQRAGLFDQARLLAAKYSEKARESVSGITHEPLKTLLLHFVDAMGR